MDARLLAESLGWTVAQAERKLRLEDRTSSLLGKLRSTFRDQFGKAAYSTEPDGPLTVTFVGPVPPEAVAMAAQFGDSVRLVSGAAISNEEALERSDAVAAALPDLGFDDFGVIGDPQTGIVRVTARKTDATPTTEDEVVARLPESLREHVHITLTTRVVTRPLTVYGGDQTGI